MGSKALDVPLTDTVLEPKRSADLIGIVYLLAILPTFTNLRIGSFQSEDFVLLFLFGVCALKFLYSGFSYRIAIQLSSLFKSYILFFFILVLLSILSVRLQFFSLEDVSFLKRPILFSLSKLLQLFAVVCGFFWLTNAFLRKKEILFKAMNAYWITGVAVALYAIFCYIFISIAHNDLSSPPILGAYYTKPESIRARGFFNEGGPFGNYLVSVFVIGYLRRHLTGQKLGSANLFILITAFILASSKAGFMVAVLLLLFSILSTASFTKKILYLVLSAGILSILAIALDFDRQVNGYIESYQNIEQVLAAKPWDYNVVVGRVSALYIVPRMIEAHPITGIGFGNYPLMRNDPHYLGALPTVRQVEDLPGVGIPGIAAEIGIPATIWLVILFLIPAWKSRKKATIIGVAAIFQLFAHACAVQLTFFYPWFVSACAMAALSSNSIASNTNQSLTRGKLGDANCDARLSN